MMGIMAYSSYDDTTMTFDYSIVSHESYGYTYDFHVQDNERRYFLWDLSVMYFMGSSISFSILWTISFEWISSSRFVDRIIHDQSCSFTDLSSHSDFFIYEIKCKTFHDYV